MNPTEINKPIDTPLDACPHCGAKHSPHITTVDEYECETFISKGGGNTKRSKLCRERKRHQDALLRYSEELAASKAEAESYKKLALNLVQELISKCDDQIHKEQLMELTK